jgi:uncharacterized protein YdaU (DUF1376 family)
MPMYWDAYLADTTHLSTEEHGAYLLLLAAMWRRNGAVPDDDKDNARIVGLSVAKWRKLKVRLTETISGFHADGEEISQEKLKKTWKKTQEIIEKNKKNGAKGGRPRSNENKDLAKANGFVSDKPIKTIPEPEPEYKKETTSVVSKKKPQTELDLVEDPPPKPKAKRAVSLPKDWVPSDKNIEDARARNFTDQEIEDEANRFRDYHLARGTTFKDWNAAWRTWLGNVRRYAPSRSAYAPRPSAGDALLAGFAGALSERQGRG